MKGKLTEMFFEKTYKNEMERVSCEMFMAICNVVEILVEESKCHIDKDEAINMIRKEMNVVNRI